jgi:hypothetical protein
LGEQVESGEFGTQEGRPVADDDQMRWPSRRNWDPDHSPHTSSTPRFFFLRAGRMHRRHHDAHAN